MPDSELKQFALWFNQDFGILFENTEAGANAYLQALSKERISALSIEVGQFLKEHPGKDHKGLKNAWLRLGAEWWDKQELPSILKKLSIG